jgi:hypothetical protein
MNHLYGAEHSQFYALKSAAASKFFKVCCVPHRRRLSITLASKAL